MPMPRLEIMFWKRALHKYGHIQIYVNIYVLKALFQNTIYELSIGIASHFIGMAVITFWKRASQSQ